LFGFFFVSGVVWVFLFYIDGQYWGDRAGCCLGLFLLLFSAFILSVYLSVYPTLSYPLTYPFISALILPFIYPYLSVYFCSYPTFYLSALILPFILSLLITDLWFCALCLATLFLLSFGSLGTWFILSLLKRFIN